MLGRRARQGHERPLSRAFQTQLATLDRPAASAHDGSGVPWLCQGASCGQRRRESDRAEARQRGRLLIAEREKSLPADVPLHKRGFGVLEEGAS